VIDKDLLKRAINIALKNGADYSDIFVETRRSFLVQLEDGRIEKLLKGTDAGIGIRVIFKGKTSYGYTNDLNHRTILELSEMVSKSSREPSSIDTINLNTIVPKIDFEIKTPPDLVPTEKKINLLREADYIARSYHRNIKQALLVYKDTIQDVRIATSEGTVSDDRRIYTLAYIQVVAGDNGKIQTGYESTGGFIGFELFDEHPFGLKAEKASARAIMMLNAPRAPAGRMGVVISPEAGGTLIHEAIGHGLEADLAGQGLSVYSHKMGQRVASDLVTVIDDATLPNMRGSLRFDDEGTPSQRTVLVDKGVLVNYMYDRLNAMKEGRSSTGNGRRESYQHRPLPRMTNTYIAPGSHSPEDIIRSVHNGILVKKMGGGQVNTVTGDFVFEVQEGYLIRNGTVEEPVRGAMLTGNGPDILKSIDMVTSDLDFSIGTCGKDAQGVPVSDAMPMVRIPEMVVGGEVR
jgi:TldD protein